MHEKFKVECIRVKTCILLCKMHYLITFLAELCSFQAELSNKPKLLLLKNGLKFLPFQKNGLQILPLQPRVG